MNNVSKEDSDFVKRIIDILLPMESVVTQENQGIIELHKENTLFGRIENKKLFLMNQIGKFAELDKELVDQAINEKKDYKYRDKLVIRATKAFWLAADRKNSK